MTSCGSRSRAGAVERGDERFELPLPPDERRCRRSALHVDAVRGPSPAVPPRARPAPPCPSPRSRVRIAVLDRPARSPAWSSRRRRCRTTGAAVCSLEAVLRTSPKGHPLALERDARRARTSVSPVVTPIRKWSSRAGSLGSFLRPPSPREPQAPPGPRAPGSSSCAVGAPNSASTASPMNFSTVPPNRSSTAP